MANISSAGSVSRIKIEISVQNKGVVTGELARHLAPLTCSALIKGLPVEDRIHCYSNKFLYIETKLVIGAEKQRTAFKRGDLAFMTSNGAVCFFVHEAITPPLNPIGHLTSNLEMLEGLVAGDVVTISRLTQGSN